MKLQLLALFVSFLCVQGQNLLPRLLDTVPFPYPPAFMELHEDDDAVDPIESKTLYISTFQPLAALQYDSVYYLRGPGNYLNDISNFVSNMEEVEENNFWPNNPDKLPASVVGREGVIWTSGFLVPGKTDGRLNMYFWDDVGWDGPYNIASKDERGWSYHRVVFRDMDNDGDEDALTARFHVNTFTATTDTQFLWFENLGIGPSIAWPAHNIATGRDPGTQSPDVHFRHVDLPGAEGGTYDAYVCAQFWNQSIAVWYTEDNEWADINLEFKIKTVVVDAPGQIFDVYVDDFNRDGNMDVLATVYNTVDREGFVYIYQITDNWKNGNWERVTIADGFEANFILGGQSMTPGSPKPFYPSKEYEEALTDDGRQRKPYILLSGDDDGSHYILTPNSEDVDDWTYTKNLLVDTTFTTSGKFVVGDMDNDGYTDIIVAGYSAKTLYFYTYAPEA